LWTVYQGTHEPVAIWGKFRLACGLYSPVERASNSAASVVVILLIGGLVFFNRLQRNLADVI